MNAKRVLISVYDKTGALDFARGLASLGYEIISTGGTASHLREGGIEVIDVSDVTGFPECLDGRVKTLHPNIHAGILAMRDNPEHVRRLAELRIDMIDIVVCNLYPFEATIQKSGVSLAEAIENIDIGGPSMLRAAAKNYQDVIAVIDPMDYGGILSQIRENGDISRENRLKLCAKVFEHTAAYDALIVNFLTIQQEE